MKRVVLLQLHWASNVYTHFSREFMKREAQKVIYNLNPLE